MGKNASKSLLLFYEQSMYDSRQKRLRENCPEAALPCPALPYAHSHQMTSAPLTAAISVNGMPMRMKSRVVTL